MGAEVNLENETLATPLIWASMIFRDSIPTLLEAGADPNYVSSKGGVLAPLDFMAVLAINPTVGIQILLGSGADINLDAGDGTVLKEVKLRANGHAGDYKLYSEIHDFFCGKNFKLPVGKG